MPVSCKHGRLHVQHLYGIIASLNDHKIAERTLLTGYKQIILLHMKSELTFKLPAQTKQKAQENDLRETEGET